MSKIKKKIDLDVFVKPNSSKDEIKICGSTLEIKLAARPIENAANKRLIKYLSELTKIPQSKFCVSGGLHSRNKKISCDGYCGDEILEILNDKLHLQ